MTYHHVNLSLAFLYHEHTPQSNRLISIVTSKGVPHARDKILITSPLAGSNLQDLMKHVQKKHGDGLQSVTSFLFELNLKSRLCFSNFFD